ncbi:uncharacterized protein LOC144702576 [Wolffia australiana]
MPSRHIAHVIRENGCTLTILTTVTGEERILDIINEFLIRGLTAAPPSQQTPHDLGRIWSEVRRTEDMLRLLKTRSYIPGEDTDSCAVCLEEYEAGEEVVALQCNHLFHANCIASWLMQRNVCPICVRVAQRDAPFSGDGRWRERLSLILWNEHQHGNLGQRLCDDLSEMLREYLRLHLQT